MSSYIIVMLGKEMIRLKIKRKQRETKTQAAKEDRVIGNERTKSQERVSKIKKSKQVTEEVERKKGNSQFKDSDTDRIRTEKRQKKKRKKVRKESERRQCLVFVLSAGQDRAGCHFCQQ